MRCSASEIATLFLREGASPYPVDGKALYDTTGSANSSDTSVDGSGTKGKDGTTFVSAGLGKDHYRPVESYEGIHRYDPDFVWEKKEEKRKAWLRSD